MEKSKLEDDCIKYLAREGGREQRFLFELELSLNEGLKEEFRRYKMIWEAYPTRVDDQWIDQRPKGIWAGIGTKPKKLWVALSVALSLGLAGYLTIGNGYEPIRITTGAMEQLTHYLPDSSKVVLNAQSSISIDEDFLNHRMVRMKGEAFFKVTHREDLPFKVYTDNIEVLVLGTQFNVKTTDSMQTVSLESGKVSMRIPDNGMHITLLPNEQVIYDPKSKQIDKRSFAVEETLAWKEEVLEIRDRSLKEALPIINNYYGAQFVLGDSLVGHRSIVGRFRGKDVEGFRDALEFITGFTIDKTEAKIFLIRTDED